VNYEPSALPAAFPLLESPATICPVSIAAYRRPFPQAKSVIVPGAGHVAYLEQPALYIGLVHAFLTGQQWRLPTTEVTAQREPQA
jgi:hypothetical protein